jgi:bifunctional oligoribonuclease and PAP phosphatase NrnA
MTRSRISEVAEAIVARDSFLLTAHVRPDGDACGASLALWHGLTRLGKRAVLSLHDRPPERYAFLPWRDQPARPLAGEAGRDFDAAIALDCDGIDRTGSLADVFRAAPIIMDVDHHAGLKAFGDIQAVYEDASSTGELVFELLEALGVPLDEEIATCLLTAILFDTGSYRNANTTPKAHLYSARLIDAGADSAQIAFRVFGEVPYRAVALKARALTTARLVLQGRGICARITLDDFRETGAVAADSEGFVEELKLTAGIDVAVLLVESSEGGCKVSFRSVNGLDVAGVANTFGGGGHRRAAGCSVAGSVEAGEAAVIARLAAALGAAEGAR